MNSSYGTAPTPESKMAQVKKVRWAVLRESIQHPTTVFPLAIASVAGIYASAIHFDATSFLWTAVPALLGVGSWIYHYFIRFDKIANKHLEKLKFQALELKKSVAEELYKECRHHGFSEGAKEVRELEQAFIQLWTFLKDQQGGAPIASAERFLSLAEDSFQEGLGMLRSGLETFKLLKTLDHQKLQREVVAWMAEMKKYERDPERYAIQMSALKTKIQSHHTRLNIYRDKLNQVHQFLAQSE
ncbi:MAG: hypothetical protein KDC71_17465, partial [Acidobacteria bacterium]|nr:hypothetical protein [Acidobacteriota bacterium]